MSRRIVTKQLLHLRQQLRQLGRHSQPRWRLHGSRRRRGQAGMVLRWKLMVLPWRLMVWDVVRLRQLRHLGRHLQSSPLLLLSCGGHCLLLLQQGLLLLLSCGGHCLLLLQQGLLLLLLLVSQQGRVPPLFGAEGRLLPHVRLHGGSRQLVLGRQQRSVLLRRRRSQQRLLLLLMRSKGGMLPLYARLWVEEERRHGGRDKRRRCRRLGRKGGSSMVRRRSMRGSDLREKLFGCKAVPRQLLLVCRRRQSRLPWRVKLQRGLLLLLLQLQESFWTGWDGGQLRGGMRRPCPQLRFLLCCQLRLKL
jgi:hypothetical protein